MSEQRYLGRAFRKIGSALFHLERRMPTSYIEKLSREGKGSVESLEKKWDEAKAQAKKEGKGKDFAYITGIFKRMAGVSESMVLAAVTSIPPKEKAAKDKTALLAQKMLISHLHPTPTVLVKDLHVTHSWAKKPARSFADPRFAFTVLIPVKGWKCDVNDAIKVWKEVKSVYKEIGRPYVYGTQTGILVSIGFTTGLAKAELMDDIYG